MKYSMKPVIVEAFKLPSENGSAEPFTLWAEEVGFTDWFSGRDATLALVSEGEVIDVAEPGDWIVKQGDDFVCYKPDVFEGMFERVH